MAQEQHLWLAAARDPAVALELEAIYQMIADSDRGAGPGVLGLRGGCCNFEEDRAPVVRDRAGGGVHGGEAGEAGVGR